MWRRRAAPISTPVSTRRARATGRPSREGFAKGERDFTERAESRESPVDTIGPDERLESTTASGHREPRLVRSISSVGKPAAPIQRENKNEVND